jgi:hypothetical protein
MPRFHHVPARPIHIIGITDVPPIKRVPRLTPKQVDVAPTAESLPPVQAPNDILVVPGQDNLPPYMMVPDSFYEHGMPIGIPPWNQDDDEDDEDELPEHVIHQQAPGFHHHVDEPQHVEEFCTEAPYQLFDHDADCADVVNDPSFLTTIDSDSY